MPIFLSNRAATENYDRASGGWKTDDGLYSAEKKRAPSEEGALKRFNIILGMNDETFCTLVGTGGKGEDRIIGSHRHACIIERGSSQFIQKSCIGIVRMISVV